MVTTETGSETPSGSSAVSARRRRPRRVRRPLALLLAFGFFFGPAMAFLVGARPQAIENRALTTFPSLSDGWAFFPTFTTWAVDHLPLRGEAVRANAAVSENVFHEPPSTRADSAGGPVGGAPGGDSSGKFTYPKVIQGQDGWLYFGSDASNLCTPIHSVADTLDRLNRLAHAVQSSGRRFVLLVAPDKSTVYPDKLPDSYVGKDCSTTRRTAFWNALEKRPPAGYVDLRGPLEAAQKSNGVPIYRQTDTHWAPQGAAVYAQQLAKALDPKLLATTQVRPDGTVTRRGDLGSMLSHPQDDTMPEVQVRRDGVTPVGRDSLTLPYMPFAPVTVTDRTTGAPLFTPPTILLGDSFTTASRDAIGGLFANLTLLHNEVAAKFPEAVANQMTKSGVVVYEIVERSVASGRGGLLSDASLAAIEKTLAANPTKGAPAATTPPR